MNIVQEVCDRIAFLKNGEIIKVDTHENLKKLIKDKNRIKIRITSKRFELIEILKKKDFISEIEIYKNSIKFSFEHKENYSEIFKIFEKFQIEEINNINPTLDDVFIKLSK